MRKTLRRGMNEVVYNVSHSDYPHKKFNEISVENETLSARERETKTALRAIAASASKNCFTTPSRRRNPAN